MLDAGTTIWHAFIHYLFAFACESIAGMSYGKPQFSENVRLVGPNPMNDPQNYNLNQGLFNFAKDVEGQISELNQKLDHVMRLLRQINAKS